LISSAPCSLLLLILHALVVLPSPCQALSTATPCPEPLTHGEQPPGSEAALDHGFDLSPYVSGRTGIFLALGGLAAAIAWNNEDPIAPAKRLDRSTFDPVMDIGNTYGSGLVLGGSTLTLLAVGGFTSDDQISGLATDLCWSYLSAAAVTGIFKHTVDRPRPADGGLSFPSGHTSSAFSAVPVVFHHLGWQAGMGATLMATATGLGRMEEERHYLSDVLFGAAIGLAVGDAVVCGKHGGAGGGGLTVMPGGFAYAARF